MKLTIGIATALLCALPFSGAFAMGSNPSHGAIKHGWQHENSTAMTETHGNVPSQMDNSKVLKAQRALAQAGAQVPTDGRMGPKTERAILNYQSAHNLPITGKLDPATLKSLKVS